MSVVGGAVGWLLNFAPEWQALKRRCNCWRSGWCSWIQHYDNRRYFHAKQELASASKSESWEDRRRSTAKAPGGETAPSFFRVNTRLTKLMPQAEIAMISTMANAADGLPQPGSLAGAAPLVVPPLVRTSVGQSDRERRWRRTPSVGRFCGKEWLETQTLVSSQLPGADPSRLLGRFAVQD